MEPAEVSILHLLFWYLIILVLTYPISLILISTGYLKKSKKVKSPYLAVFRKANEIVKNQIIVFFFAWLFSCAVCVIFIFFSLLIGACLVKLNLIEANQDLTNPIILIPLVIIHLIGQVLAYLQIIKDHVKKN